MSWSCARLLAVFSKSECVPAEVLSPCAGTRKGETLSAIVFRAFWHLFLDLSQVKELAVAEIFLLLRLPTPANLPLHEILLCRFNLLYAEGNLPLTGDWLMLCDWTASRRPQAFQGVLIRVGNLKEPVMFIPLHAPDLGHGFFPRSSCGTGA